MAELDSEKEEEILKKDLKFYFMNPCEKYRARCQIPWKLGLQILKIVMVTTQLVMFGLSNQLVVSFKEENTVAFKHLFLKGFTGVDEDDYSRTVYTQQEVYDSIYFALNQYHQIRNLSLGTVGYEHAEDMRGIKICKRQYRRGAVLPNNYTFFIDPTIEKECISSFTPHDWHTINSTFFNLEFYRLIHVEIFFKLKGIALQTIRARELPDCYVFHNTVSLMMIVNWWGFPHNLTIHFYKCNDLSHSILLLQDSVNDMESLLSTEIQLMRDRLGPLQRTKILFDNQAHSGKIKIFFDSDAYIEDCKDWHISGSIQKNSQGNLVFDGFVILTCLTSLILCTRSIVLALKLQRRFVKLLLEKYNRRVCRADRLEFINGWYVMVIISDLMTIIGSILKMEIKVKNLSSYDVCSLLLGSSTLLVWVGVIRYLGYFQKYNVLILTMQASFPKVLRFCCCAGMIYLGYTFCGWIVLGPYHEKFEDLNTVAECLFSLVNGDDMFATFAQIQQKSMLVWLFSRLYLYSFISLFIYMILSLFIALITDSYETIKKYQQNGFPATDLHEFLKESDGVFGTDNYRKETQPSMPFFCCCQRPGVDDDFILIN